MASQVALRAMSSVVKDRSGKMELVAALYGLRGGCMVY